jgi:hypothetical protein
VPQPCVSGCSQDYEHRKGSHVHNHAPADRRSPMTVCKDPECAVLMRRDEVFNRAGRFMCVGWTTVANSPGAVLTDGPVVPAGPVAPGGEA